jgi:hypothetical protein
MRSKIVIVKTTPTGASLIGVDSLTQVYDNTQSGDLVTVYPGTYDIGNNSIVLKDGVNWSFMGKPTIISSSTNGTFDASSATEVNPIRVHFEGKVNILNTNGVDPSPEIGETVKYLINESVAGWSSITGIEFVIALKYNFMGWIEGNPSPPHEIEIFEDDFNNGEPRMVQSSTGLYKGIAFANFIPFGDPKFLRYTKYISEGSYGASPLFPPAGYKIAIQLTDTNVATYIRASIKPNCKLGEYDNASILEGSV